MSIQPTDPPAWASLLEKIQGETGLQKAFGQHYTNDGGYLSVTFNTDKGMTVYLVTSSRTLTEADPTLAKPYADLVQPRWSKPALEVYLTNEREPDPPTKFQRLKAALDSMLDFGQHSTDSAIVCCWVIGTYLYQLFDAYPYLGILGPKGSGKTKLGQVIEEVAFNSIRTASITTAQLFRTAEVTAGTLILDEQEALESRFAKDDRLSLLRDGYKKGSTVLRSTEVSGDYKTRLFVAYGPKVIITTSGVEELLADRCIGIHLLRSNSNQGKELVTQHLEELHAVRDDLYSLALTVFLGVSQDYRDAGFSYELNNRQRERWLPLLAIANQCCPDRLEDIQAVASKDIGGNILADPFDTLFLQTLSALVDQATAELTADQIGVNMGYRVGSPWPIRSTTIGKLITKFLGKVGRRSGEKGSNRYYITRAQIDDLLNRYQITEETEG